MPIFPQKNGKRIISRSIYIKALIFCCLVAVSAVVLQPVQELLHSTMNDIRQKIILNLEEITETNIRYDSIRPAIFGSFEIRNLKFYKEGRVLLSVPRASIRFSFLKLIFQDKSAIHTVYIDKPVLRIDLQRDIDFIKKIADGREYDDGIIIQEIAEYLPSNVNYIINNFSLLLVNNEFIFQVDNMNINIKGDGQDILFDTSFYAEMRYSGIDDRTIILSTDIDIKSIGQAGLQRINADILLSSAACYEQRIITNTPSLFRPVSAAQETSFTAFFTVRPFNINLSYDNNVLSVTQMPDNNLSYIFSYNLETQAMNFDLSMNEFIPARNINFNDMFINSKHLMDITVSGNVNLIKEESGNISYFIDINGSNNKDIFTADILGTDNNLNVKNLYLYASDKTLESGFFQGEISVNGNIDFKPFNPELNISFNNLTFTGKDTIKADIKIENKNELTAVYGSNLLIGDVKLNELLINIEQDENDIVITADFLFNDNSLTYIDAVFDAKSQLDAIIVFDSLSLYNIAGICRPFVNIPSLPVFADRFLEANKLDAEIYFSYSDDNIIYHVPNIILYNDNVMAEVSVSGTDLQFNINRGVVYLEESPFLFTCNTMINNPADLNFKLNAGFQDVSWNIEGQILDGNTLIISDQNGLHVYGNMSNTGAISGYVEGINYPLPFNSNLVYLNFYTTLRYYSYDFWSIDVSYFEASDINSGSDESALRISGSIDQDGASFREILFNDDTGMLFGNSDFTWDPDLSYLQFYLTMTDGYENGEFYSFEGGFKNEQIIVNSIISNMQVNRFIKNNNSKMLVSAEANILWESISSFKAEINMTEYTMIVLDTNIKGSGNLLFTNDNLLVQDLYIDMLDLNINMPVIEINRKEGFAFFQTKIKGLLQKKNFEVVADFNSRYNTTDTWENIAQAFLQYEGYLFFDTFHFGDVFYRNIEFVFEGENNSLSVIGGIDEMFRLEMDETGNFYMGLSSPLPIRGSIAGTLSKDLYLDVHCNYFFIDLKSLYDIATPVNNSFGIDGGFITGKMDIKGPVLNPEFFGVAKGSSLVLKVPDFITEDIYVVPFNITAEGYEMTFGPVTTLCGLGGGSASGWFRFEFWGPKNVGLEINIPSDTPVPYNFGIANFMAQGDASGYFALNADFLDNQIEIHGRLLADNTEMVANLTDISSDQNGEEVNVIADLKITSGQMIEFFWPNKNTPILRATPEMGTEFHVTADTRNQQYSIIGDVSIKSGELSYLDRNFKIRQGSMIFRENERSFNPLITARAEIRDRIDSGAVTVAMIIENQPLFSFEPRFESDPTLTQLELYSILGQNITVQGSDDPEEIQRFLISSTTDIVTQVMSTSDTWGQIVFLRQIERNAREFLNLDMFSIRTRFLQNAIVSGIDAGLMGAVPDNRGFNLGNFFDNTSVSIGKYIGQDMFIQGTFAIKYDENSAFLGGISFEPDIGIEWQTPFVNIRWSWIPTNSYNWFVDNNSITLSWSRTF